MKQIVLTESKDSNLIRFSMGATIIRRYEPNYDPNTPINSIVKAFKGRSSRYLRQEFPQLLKLPTLWTHAYFYDTTSKVSSAIIEQYINDPHHYK